MRAPLQPDERDALLEGYVARALERRDDGHALDLAELCASHPELEPEVAAAIGIGADLSALHRASHGFDGRIGAVLHGRYRIEALVGRGAAGSVYRARDSRLDREIAVKLLHAGPARGPTAEERFIREATVLARLEHPHVVRIYDSGHAAADELFLVTELLDGTSLADLLERARLAMPDGASAAAFAQAGWLQIALPRAQLASSLLRQFVTWIADLGDGLEAAHAIGVIHRDVKPSNAFVCADGRIVLLDFGIAASSADPALTLEKSVLGTPWYMPPEQARGRVAPAPTLDVYGLGASLYHLLTLHPPHEGELHEVLAAVRDRDPVPATARHPGLSRDLAAIVDRALDADAARRYPTVAAFVADLRAFLDHRPVSARPLGPLGRSWRRARRRPARTAAVLGAVATIALAGIALPLLTSAWKSARAGERADLLAGLAADLCIEGWPDQRGAVPIAERSTVLRELDRLLELAPEDDATRLLRASERLDAGDHSGATADLDAMATREESPYLRAVARCYAAADSSRSGIESIEFAELPEPATGQECFVAGFHALRRRDVGSAATLLERAIDYPPARDLRLLALLAIGNWEEAAAEASRLEERYGRPTARTEHTLGAAMLGLRRYDDAIAHCERALELRPERHGPWNNLGYAHLRLGHLTEARRCLERAVAIRPWFDNSQAGLCQVLRALEDFPSARDAAGKIGATWWREWELANVDLAEALALHRDGDASRDRARELARSAVDGFRRSLADPDPAHHKRKSGPLSIEYATAIAGRDEARAIAPFLMAMRSDPRNPIQLVNLADLLANQALAERDLDLLRLFLVELALDMSPDDPRITSARTGLLDSLRKKER